MVCNNAVPWCNDDNRGNSQKQQQTTTTNRKQFHRVRIEGVTKALKTNTKTTKTKKKKAKTYTRVHIKSTIRMVDAIF